MFNTNQVIQSVVDRILFGRVTPVKKEFQEIIKAELMEEGIAFNVSEDTSNTGRVLFSRTKVGAGLNCDVSNIGEKK